MTSGRGNYVDCRLLWFCGWDDIDRMKRNHFGLSLDNEAEVHNVVHCVGGVSIAKFCPCFLLVVPVFCHALSHKELLSTWQ